MPVFLDAVGTKLQSPAGKSEKRRKIRHLVILQRTRGDWVNKARIFEMAKSGAQIAHESFTDFDRWQRHQDAGVRSMSLVQQASHYANDDDWHNKGSEADYAWRNAALPHSGGKQEMED